MAETTTASVKILLGVGLQVFGYAGDKKWKEALRCASDLIFDEFIDPSKSKKSSQASVAYGCCKVFGQKRVLMGKGHDEQTILERRDFKEQNLTT